MATGFRRNFEEIKDITLDSVAANGNAATSPSRRGVMRNAEQRDIAMELKIKTLIKK